MRTEAAEQTSEAVHGLIEACEDGHDGYHAAAGGVVDGSLRNILESFSEERARFAADLRAAFERAGGQLHNVHEHPGGVWSKVQALAQAKTTFSTVMQRPWIKIYRGNSNRSWSASTSRSCTRAIASACWSASWGRPRTRLGRGQDPVRSRTMMSW
jgi:hypothetical protein